MFQFNHALEEASTLGSTRADRLLCAFPYRGFLALSFFPLVFIRLVFDTLDDLLLSFYLGCPNEFSRSYGRFSFVYLLAAVAFWRNPQAQ